MAYLWLPWFNYIYIYIYIKGFFFFCNKTVVNFGIVASKAVSGETESVVRAKRIAHSPHIIKNRIFFKSS